MLKILVSFALGPMWLKVLYFYLDHDAIINSILFIYGVFLVVAHLNYKKISDQVFNQITANGEKTSKKKVIEVNIPMAIKEKKMFPFIAGQISIIPKNTTSEAVKNYMLKEKKWKELIGDKKVLFIE